MNSVLFRDVVIILTVLLLLRLFANCLIVSAKHLIVAHCKLCTRPPHAVEGAVGPPTWHCCRLHTGSVLVPRLVVIRSDVYGMMFIYFVTISSTHLVWQQLKRFSVQLIQWQCRSVMVCHVEVTKPCVADSIMSYYFSNKSSMELDCFFSD